MAHLANFNDLTDDQREALGRLLTDKLKDRHGNAPNLAFKHGDHVVGLVHNKRVVAAIVTDGKDRVHLWAGAISPSFFGECKTTPASEIMKQHLARTRKRVIRFSEGLMGREADNLLEKIEDPEKFEVTFDGKNSRIEMTAAYAGKMSTPKLPFAPETVWAPWRCSHAECPTCFPKRG